MPRETPTLVKATLRCLGSDPDCFGAVASKPMIGGPDGYPAELSAFSTEVLATPDGGRINMRLVIRNPTEVAFGPFKTIVSPGVILQGRPVRRPPIYLLEVSGLAAGATGVFFANDVPLEMPADGRFSCLDVDFQPPST